MAAAVPDASLFRSGRQFAAWLGLTPRAHSSGGRERQAGISKQGDGYLRRLLVVGATAVMRMARQSAVPRLWLMELLERKRSKVVAVALANKTARIAWAIMTRNQIYAARAA
jgi:transposase